MKTYQILILEDLLPVQSAILAELAWLEEKLLERNLGDLAVTVYSTHADVTEYVNSSKKRFDIILLDRDCKLAGSFHVIDQAKLDEADVIAISAGEEWNRQARERGVTRVIQKDIHDLKSFAVKVAKEVESILLR